jgi:hypothetical protein
MFRDFARQDFAHQDLAQSRHGRGLCRRAALASVPTEDRSNHYRIGSTLLVAFHCQTSAKTPFTLL